MDERRGKVVMQQHEPELIVPSYHSCLKTPEMAETLSCPVLRTESVTSTLTLHSGVAHVSKSHVGLKSPRSREGGQPTLSMGAPPTFPSLLLSHTIVSTLAGALLCPSIPTGAPFHPTGTKTQPRPRSVLWTQ